MSARESRPRQAAEAAPKSVVVTQHQDTEAARIPHLSASEREVSRPLYVLLLKSPSDRITRRVYLSLHAAVKACRRAEARGCAVSLELCRVVPYAVGAELHGTEGGGQQ